MKKRITIGITMGDPAGIGAEITVKVLNNPVVYEECIPMVIGDYEAIKDAIKFCGLSLNIKCVSGPSECLGEYGTIELYDMGFLKKGGWEYKKPSAVCGEASFQYILKGIDLAMKKEIGAVITAPINKEAIHLAGYNYSGHTEIFADYTNTPKYAMLLASGNLRVIHVTTHCSLRVACDRIKKDRVYDVINFAKEGLSLLGIDNPKIAVAGLNPHSSENGLFGDEEQNEIIPAIEKAQANGIDVTGPVPPDTVFVKALGGKYDVVVAMYHDQGHIPLKLLGFKMSDDNGNFSDMSGINCTIGLPVIRSSVDHGTAYGKAGEGRANEGSLLDAINAGILMAKNKFPELTE